MQFRCLRFVVVLLASALLMLIGIQLYWAWYSYKLNEKTFRANVTEALRSTATTMNGQLTCFELFSKIRINPSEGIYMLKHEWKNDSFISGANALDTVPMYFPHANQHIGFNHQALMMSYPTDLEMVMRFRILTDENVDRKEIPEDTSITVENFREKLSDNTPIALRYDTVMLDSVLKTELKQFAIHDDFHFGYIRSENDSIEFRSAGASARKLLATPFKIRLTNDEYFNQPYELAVYFRNYSSVIFSSIRTVLIVSGVIIVLVLLGFIQFIRIIYRQRKLSSLKNDFINNMTHEFKTPLANISVALEMLSNNGFSEKEKEKKVLQIIGQEADRLRENTEKILQVARFEKEKVHLMVEELDMHQVIRKAVSSFETYIELNQVKFVFNFMAENSIVEADETHMINVLCNLIDNSIKYSKEPAEITITTEQTSAGLNISVSDQGIGISKETQKRIFEKFYRVPDGDIHNVKGFGLGLTYVKSIVEAHHGQITVKSQPGAGSEFRLVIPYSYYPSYERTI